MRQVDFDQYRDKIPSATLDGLKRYYQYGIAPGGFLTAVLCNDLAGAVGKADQHNIHCLKDICTLLHWDFPIAAWGSESNVKQWMASRLAAREMEAANDYE